MLVRLHLIFWKAGSIVALVDVISEKQVARNLMAQRIPVLSFFTGAGFLDIGFIQAGFDIIWSNEFNTSFVNGYSSGMATLFSKSHKEVKLNTSSIVDLGPNQIARESFHNTPRPEVFGIIGGPPCPDFSVGGKNRGREGDNGKLSQVYVNRITELQPTFFLFENVPGLFRTKKHREFFELMKLQLQEHYLVDYRILNALHFGVPQDRERVFIVGVHRKWARKNMDLRIADNESDWFPWPFDSRFDNAKKRFTWPGESPFGDSPLKPSGVPNELMVYRAIGDFEEISRLPNGLEGFRPKSPKFLTIAEGDVSRKSFKRLHRYKYSPTAAYGNNEVHLHPFLPRRITVREALRIQTVPDTYELPPDMTLTSKFKTIGNGVPVNLAFAIAQAFAKLLRGEVDA